MHFLPDVIEQIAYNDISVYELCNDINKCYT